MGQRTAIIVQHVNNHNHPFAEIEERLQTRVFYHGWGIGRILPSHLVAVVNAIRSVGLPQQHDGVKQLKPQGTIDITDNYDPVTQALLDELDFDHPEYVGDILKGADNNNGGAFVRITTNEQGDTNKIEFAFMLGEEEEGDYKHFCTLWEWMDKVDPKKRHCDQDFRNMLYEFLLYHKCKDRSKGEVTEADNNDEETA